MLAVVQGDFSPVAILRIVSSKYLKEIYTWVRPC